MRRAGLIVIGLIVLASAALLWSRHSNPQSSPAFQTASVQKGDLLATVSATGTIEPEEVVDVGAQVMGMIKELGRDPADSSKFIDYRSSVEEGTVLARIDDALYKARLNKAAAAVEEARAGIDQAKADLRRAEADILQMRAKFHQAERDWVRAKKLWPGHAVSDLDYDTMKAAYEVTTANLRVAEAVIEQARASREKADKTLMAASADRDEAQKNLEYTTIRSPVKGVIVDRRVNVGQTVVSSLNAPSLFLIAKDLKRLEVWASVNEADIGRIQAGQGVRFTVDAYPGEAFRGEVEQVRLNATMTQNVVTYTVVVTTDNASGRLLPYLTANLKFEIDRRRQILLVPNAALRWQPDVNDVAPEEREAYLRSQRAGEMAAGSGNRAEETRRDQGSVWIVEGACVRPVKVRIGLSDGLLTEIAAGELSQGQAVVVGERPGPESAGSSASPFTPRLMTPSKR